MVIEYAKHGFRGISAVAALICLQVFEEGCYTSIDLSCTSNADWGCDSSSLEISGSDADTDSSGSSVGDVDINTEWECYQDTASEFESDDNAQASVSRLVCVFDIDDTLTCAHSAEAVAACKDVGAVLAVNTAEGHNTAINNKNGTGYIDWGALGFPTVGTALDMSFGAFMFGRCANDCSCSEAYGGEPGDCEWCSDCGADCPASFMGKAYGMYRIQKYYGVEPNECLVLFDDLPVNTNVVQTFCYSAYNQGDCASGWNNEGVYQQVYDYLTGDRFADCK